MPSIDRKDLNAKVNAVFEQVVAWRRHIHMRPELSYKEFETAAYIESELRKMDPEGKYLDIKKPIPNALIVDMKGTKPGGSSDKMILLRADIDALPVTELTDIDFKSKHTGVMHACGHDTHAAMLLGAAKLLVDDVDKIDGTVRFLFQHAEELAPGGAKELIKHGCCDGVSMAFSMHILPLPMGPTGSVMIRKGVFLNSADMFTIRIVGRGGHASMPELAVDPVSIAAQVMVGMQSIVTRRLPSSNAPVLTVASVHTSTDTFNVIADDVTLKGCIRCDDPTVRSNTMKYMEELVKGTAEAFGGSYEFTWHDGYHVTMNHPDAYAETVECLKQILPSEDKMVVLPNAFKGSEDFSFIAEKVPSNYVGLGSYNPSLGCDKANHSPHFKVDEECFRTGVALHYATIYQTLMQ